MSARPYTPFSRTLGVLAAALAVAVFGLSAVAVRAQESPESSQSEGDGASKNQASDDKESGKDKKSGSDEKAGDDKKSGKRDSKARSRSRQPQRAKQPAKRESQPKQEDADADKPATAAEDGSEDPAEPPKVEIDPELRKRIDDLIEAEEAATEEKEKDKTPARSRKRKARTPQRGKPAARDRSSDEPSKAGPPRPGKKADESAASDEGPSGPTTQLDIPPQAVAVSPEERMYNFSIKDTSYEQLIEMVARQTGLGVIGQAPKDGTVSFVTEEELTFNELMNRVKMLLAAYKAHDPYTLIRRDTHLEVTRVADYYRDLPRKRMYGNVEEYEAAELSDYELALVLYTPKSGSVSDLSVIRDFMPDYVRITPLEDSNAVTIFAFTKHIEKYLALIPIFVGGSSDPRTLAVIEVEHIAPSDAVNRLQVLMDLETEVVSTRRPTPRKGRAPEPSALSGIPEPDVSVVPDDAQGVILVRAMQEKIEEIKMLLPYIDVDTSTHYDPVVIEVAHVDPDELIATIQQILSASDASATGKPATGKPKKATKRKRPRKRKTPATLPMSSPLKAEDVTLMRHPSARAIIVMAEEEDVDRVRRLVEMLDKERVVEERIILKYADANEVAVALAELVGGQVGASGSEEAFRIVPDSTGTAIWFTGTPEQLEKAREVVAVMDTADGVAQLHIVRLVNQTPSFVAGILAQYDGSGAGPVAKKAAPRPKRKGAKARPAARAQKKSTAVAKFTPDDENGRLYVLCTNAEWAEYEVVIQQLEDEVIPEEFILLATVHITPDEAIAKVSSLLNQGQVAKIQFETTADQIIVKGASVPDLTEIRAILAQVDREIETVERTFEIRYADPGELASTIEALVGENAPRGAARKAAPRRGQSAKGKKATGLVAAAMKASSDLTIVELGRHLIVRTTPEKMERVAEFIAEFDVDDDVREMRVYEDFPPGTDVADLAGTLKSLLGGKGGGAVAPKTPGKGRRAAAAEAGSRIIPHPASGKLIVFAGAEEFEEIERLLDVLRTETPKPTTELAFVEVHHAEPADLVEAIEPILQLRVEEMINTGELPSAVLASAASVSKPAGRKKGAPAAKPRSSSTPYHLEADERMSRIVISGPQAIIDAATDLIAQFDVAGSEADRIEIAFIRVEFTEPAELIELLDPLLSMKVEALISSGELTGATPKAPAAPRSAKGAKGKAGKGRAVTARGGKGKGYHLAPDEQNSRIVVAAPQVVIDEARVLVAELDQQSEEGDIIFKTVALANTQPAEMAKALREILGGPTRTKTGKGKKRSAATSMAASGEKLTVVEAPSGGALILRGPAKEVQQAEEWIQTLDQEVTGDRVIKIYEIVHADIKTLVDVIWHDVETVASTRARPTKKGSARPSARRPVAEPEEEEGFTTTITRVGTEVYIRADLIDDTILVSAPQAKIAQIDEIVAQLDPSEGENVPIPTKTVPKRMYELEYVEAFDAAFELETVLGLMWDEGELPRVDYASFGSSEMLVVKHPDADRFPEIEALIRQYVDVPDPEDLVDAQKVFRVPNKVTAEELARILQMDHPEYEFEIIDGSATEDVDYDIEEVKPYRRPQANAAPCVLPHAFQRTVDALLVSVVGPPETDEPDGDAGDDPEPVGRDDEPAEDEPAFEEEADQDDPALHEESDAGEPDGGKSARETAGAPPLAGTEARRTEQSPSTSDPRNVGAGRRVARVKRSTGERVRVKYDNATGTVSIEGKAGVLDKVDGWLEDIEKEIDELDLPPDIRVLQVRHVDVYYAAEVINEMFNATRQQRQAVTAAQRRAQQQQARLQAQQARQQQQQQQGGRGQQPGQQPGRGGRGQPQQVQMPQLPPTAVRIFPSPRDRTLIVRADSTQFTVIKRLLATIDRPQPIESAHRVFQLKKLNAVEVEELLRDWLGLDEQRTTSRPRTQQTTPRGRRGAPQRQQNVSRSGSVSTARLPQPLMQETLTAGELGVDPRDIKLSSNEAANTILAMAPKVALDYIEKLINELEGQDIQERIWRNYELQYADVEAVEKYLTSRFGDDSGTSQRKSGRRGQSARGRESKPDIGGESPLTKASFVAYPSLNMISANATGEQLEKIDEMVAKLDVPDAGDDFHSVKLVYADAGTVAETLTGMFGKGGGASKGRRGQRSAPAGGTGPKFIGEEGGKVVFYSAPERLHSQILEYIDLCEEQSKKTTTVRIIRLERAKPSKVAEAIEEAYGGRTAPTRRTGRGGGRSSAGSATGLTLTANDPAMQLFVIANDALFAEVESLAKALDVEPEIGFDFKVYPLQYASARSIYDKLDKLVTDYVRRLGRDAQIEPFSVQVDDQANALIVLGGPVVFGFVEEALRTIDVPANAASPPGFLTIPLTTGDAAEVAQNINRLWSQQTLPGDELPPVAEANRSLNAVVVRGTQAQLEEIKKQFLDELGSEEIAAQQPQVKTVQLKYADPASVKEAISQLFGRSARTPRDQVMAVADFASRSIVVSASAENMRRIEELIAAFDSEESAQQEVHVIALDNSESEAVSRTLNEIFVRSAPRQQGTQGPPISIAALQGSKAVVVKCNAEDFADIEATVAELDRDEAVIGEEVRVVALLYSDATEVKEAMQEYLRKPGAGGGRRGGAELAGDVRLAVLSQTNAIVVSGDKDRVDLIETLMMELDTAGEKGSVPQIIPLQYINVSRILPSLEEMFEEGGRKGGRGSSQQPPVIVANENLNALIIRGSPTDVQAIEAIVAKMDTEEAGDKPNFHLIKVATGINVEDLAEKVETSINEGAIAQAGGGGGRGRRGGGNVPSITVTPDRRTNSLMVSGTPTLFAEAEALVRAMEAMGPAGGNAIRIIKVPRTRTDDIVRLIEQLKGEDAGKKSSSSRSRSRTSPSRGGSRGR